VICRNQNNKKVVICRN